MSGPSWSSSVMMNGEWLTLRGSSRGDACAAGRSIAPGEKAGLLPRRPVHGRIFELFPLALGGVEVDPPRVGREAPGEDLEEPEGRERGCAPEGQRAAHHVGDHRKGRGSPLVALREEGAEGELERER